MSVTKFIQITFLTLLVSFSISAAQETDAVLLSQIRDQLPAAFENDKACSSMLAKYKKVKSDNVVLNGYIGGLYIARSRHAPLFDKMNNLKTGTGILEDALKKMPDNIELRFLRLSIQLNLPGFLGYNDNVESDKKFVLKHYDSALPVLRKRIVDFVKTSGHFTEAEQAAVN